MSSKEESAVRTRIDQFIKNEGGWSLVTSSGVKTASGKPDIIAALYGDKSGKWIHYAIEVKTDTGTADKRQVEVLRRMGDRGFIPCIASHIRQFHEVHKLVDYILSQHPVITHRELIRQLQYQNSLGGL